MQVKRVVLKLTSVLVIYKRMHSTVDLCSIFSLLPQ